MSIKRLIRKALWRFGLDLRRFDARVSEAQLVQQLTQHKVDVVLDVGANVGQFATRLRDAGFTGQIISFEPSTAAHALLTQTARYDKNWKIAPRMALGDHAGQISLNLAGNSMSSSVLPMLSSHLNAAPASRYVGSEEVVLHTLDEMIPEFTSPGDHVFLKLDVQGFERSVLQGAKGTMPRIAGIQLELSLVPLYEGESLFQPMLDELDGYGYEVWSLVPGMVEQDTARLLQVDAVFFRRPSSATSHVAKHSQLATLAQ